MTYYAIRNKKTKRYICGTDWRYRPAHQRLADKLIPPLLIPKDILESEINHRQISKTYYEIIPVEIVEKENKQ